MGFANDGNPPALGPGFLTRLLADGTRGVVADNRGRPPLSVGCDWRTPCVADVCGLTICEVHQFCAAVTWSSFGSDGRFESEMGNMRILRLVQHDFAAQ